MSSVGDFQDRKMAYEVHVIHIGYSKPVENGMKANCTCTVIKGKYNVIVDTMTPWDKDIIMKGLHELNLTCDDIDYLVSTHGHSDHIGNNNLFLKAKHIVGFSISHKNHYFIDPFTKGEPYNIDGEDLKIVPTPGHTMTDVSVIVRTQLGVVAVTGDLFERKEDLEDESIWVVAGSECPELQRKNRLKVLQMADFIVPGHGDMFTVFQDMKTPTSP